MALNSRQSNVEVASISLGEPRIALTFTNVTSRMILTSALSNSAYASLYSPNEGDPTMAYPEPTPMLKGKEVQEFIQRLDEFSLTRAQLEFFREAFRVFAESERKSVQKK